MTDDERRKKIAELRQHLAGWQRKRDWEGGTDFVVDKFITELLRQIAELEKELEK